MSNRGRAERQAVSVAAHAAIAIDNARLYEAAQREILERRRVAVALRASERRLKAVLDNATVAVFLMDPDRHAQAPPGRVFAFSPKCEKGWLRCPSRSQDAALFVRQLLVAL